MIFFTSDFHLFHKNVIRFDNRPFKDIYEMHNTIVNNWNEVVHKEDTVYYLGDLTFGSLSETKSIVHSLNGKIIFILGNHDKIKNIKAMNRFESVHSYLELRYNKNRYIMFHNPILSFNSIYHGSIHLFGHCHGNLQSIYDKHGNELTAKRLDVGCMNHNYYPINLNHVHKLVDNINFEPINHHK